MEDWFKDLWKIVDTVAAEAEQFFQEVTEVAEFVADEMGEAIEAISQVSATTPSNLDRYIQELLASAVDSHYRLEVALWESDWEDTLEDTELFRGEILEKYSACVGCCHYHGRSYGGNFLVCGMHPYGWDDKNCPDWEEEKYFF